MEENKEIEFNLNFGSSYQRVKFNMVYYSLLNKGKWILNMSNVKALKILHKKYPEISIRELREILEGLRYGF